MRKAWIALRRTLPEWRFDELAEELLLSPDIAKIDEIIVKVDVEEFSHGHPAPEWLEGYLPKLAGFRDSLLKRGIAFSLNPWITVGHADRGRDDRAKIAGFQGVVGPDGTECRHCACHLSEAWRNRIGKLWSLYASLHPRTIWIEDDFRTFNHEPVEFGCFCPLHLARFSELAGRKVSREELADAIMRPGKPHPWRRLYYGMLSDITCETAAFLAKSVHAVDSSIRIGLMTSGPRAHCAEGRDWKRLAECASDNAPLQSRPTLGVYYESDIRGLYYSADSVKLTRAVLPEGTEELTELENYPYTSFANSEVFTTMKACVSFAFGAGGIAANLFDHVGSLMSAHPTALESITEHRRFFDALVEANSLCGSAFCGVQMLFSEKESCLKEFPEGAAHDMRFAEGYSTVWALEGCGIPTTYSEMPVKILTGERARCFSDDDVRRFLSGNVFMDGMAARILSERGFGPLIGIDEISCAIAPCDWGTPISAEITDAEYFTELDISPLGCNLGSHGVKIGAHRCKPLKDTAVAAYFVDPDRRAVAPSLLWFRNGIGGRVVVHLIDYDSAISHGFFSPSRVREIQQCIRFLSDCRPELLVGPEGAAWPLAWRRRGERFDIVGCFNLSLDRRTFTRWEMAWEFSEKPKVLRLSCSGEWKEEKGVQMVLENGLLKIVTDVELSIGLPLVLLLRHG